MLTFVSGSGNRITVQIYIKKVHKNETLCWLKRCRYIRHASLISTIITQLHRVRGFIKRIIFPGNASLWQRVHCRIASAWDVQPLSAQMCCRFEEVNTDRTEWPGVRRIIEHSQLCPRLRRHIITPAYLLIIFWGGRVGRVNWILFRLLNRHNWCIESVT